MPGPDDNKAKKEFFSDVPVKTDSSFFLKGLGSYDWGLQDRMSRIFNPKSGKSVMLAFDHGYAYGPTAGLERMDISIAPLVPYADCLMCARGALRSVIPSDSNKPVALRMTAGTTILDPKVFENECVGLSIDEAIRLNASAMAVQVCVGAKDGMERVTIDNLCQLANLGNKYGIPVLGVTAVGKELVRDERYFTLATRILAENGAHFVKTYFVEEGFENVVSACPVPIIIAGGKKMPELDALTMAYRAIDQGAAGVDMGRNVFQADDPIAMIKALCSVVHENVKPEDAFDMYKSTKK